MNKVLLSLAVVCVILLSAEAKAKKEKVNCMVCSKNSGNNVNDWGYCDNADDEGKKRNCPSDTLSCSKVVKANGDITRGCSVKEVKKDSCDYKNGDLVCHCTDHYCNGAKMNALYHGILFLPIIAIITAWK